jgi:ABC-type dipeptide/oligopeptide/nickel transport system ATPase component|tara:strand:+ start:16681 stop:17325 length:645 start_codon:yes stop_codon:yes gene_type:complete
MRTKKVPGLEIKVPSGNAFAFNTDPMMFKSHQSCLVIGKRGSGKSVIAVNIIERMKYDRLFIVSPTIQSNKALLDRLKIDPDDIYDPDDLEALDDIKRKIDEERDLYEKYLADMKKYKEFMKKLNSDNPIFRIPDEVLLMFYQNGTFQKPRHKWGGRRPHMAVLFDDVMGSLLFTKGIRKLNKMTIFHRHLGQLVVDSTIINTLPPPHPHRARR